MIASIIEGLAKGIIGPITGVFNKKMDTDLEKYRVDGQVDMAAVDATVKLHDTAQKWNFERMKYLGFRMLQYGLIAPTVLWYNCVVADSIYFHSKSIEALPKNLEYIPQAVVAFLLVNLTIKGLRK
jgi:hypothetical protein